MTEPGSDEWMARRGLLLTAVWLVFLVFPLADIWTTRHPLGIRVAATALVTVFAALYVRAFRRRAWWERGFPAGSEPLDGRGALADLAALCLLAVVVELLVGPAGLGLVSFVVSFAVFHLTWRGAWTTFGLGLATVVVVPLASGALAELWFFSLIVAAVGLTTTLVRAVEGHDRERASLQTRVAVSDERNRLARDVHDVLGHSLTAVILKAELCQRLLEGVEPADAPGRDRLVACRGQLAELQTVSRSALAEIRSTVGGLRSATLADELAVARAVLADAGVALLVTGDPGSGPETVAPILPWVVREAVTNVVRHARASTCRIELGPAAGSDVALRITDDGVGLGHCPDGGAGDGVDGGRRWVEGNGLRGLRERVEAAGAQLRVGSGHPGTSVEVLAGPPAGWLEGGQG